jgi:hypothetical protein
MIADYIDEPARYSDGSEVWEWYDEIPECYYATKGELRLPPHRRTAERSHHVYGSRPMWLMAPGLSPMYFCSLSSEKR